MDTIFSQEKLDFERLAAEAKLCQILTKDEIDTICHRGTRKSPYWARHLVDLKWYIKFKINKLPAEKYTERIDNLLKRC